MKSSRGLNRIAGYEERADFGLFHPFVYIEKDPLSVPGLLFNGRFVVTSLK